MLVDLSTGAYFGLNRIGARMWTLLADGASPARVVQTLSTEHGVPPERVEADLRALLASLRERGLVDA